MDQILIVLADLLRKRNAIDLKISETIQRPATSGHIGEFVASMIFDIELMKAANNKAIDGYFRSGALSGKSVDVKFYGKQEGMLDIHEVQQPDYFLVLTGPRSSNFSSKGQARLCVIELVYLIDGKKLAEEIRRRGVKFSEATSVPKKQWEEAEIYPEQQNKELILTDEQKKMLEMFGSQS